MSTEKTYLEGLLGRKLGMTQVFGEDGSAIAVTVLEVGPCYVLSVKDSVKDGYSAVRVGFQPKKMHKVNKAEMGNFTPAARGAFSRVKEIRCDAQKLGWSELGKELKVSDVFTDGDWVDVTGTSIGRGFAGVVKRFRVAGQPATRGTHEYRRNIGSVGCRKTPGRIWKNQKMPGHMGNLKVTVQNLKVVGVRPEENVLLVKGAVPGSKGGFITIKKAIKKLK
jgi:large subunit ribosomal protein L3